MSDERMQGQEEERSVLYNSIVTFERPQTINGTDYFTPVVLRIGQDAVNLYAHEEKRNRAFFDAAEEWAKVCGFTDDEYQREKFTRFVPQAMFDMLDGIHPDCAIVAAKVFLEKHGYQVTK